MKSMTGYGRGDSTTGGVQLSVEISSVNRRQVEVAVSLPSELDSLESDLRKIVLASVARGRVSGRVALQRPSGKASRSILINEAQANAYKKALAKLARGMSLQNDFSMETLLRLPGVMETGEEAKRLGCKHVYHPACIDRWLERSRLCPVCKRDVCAAR